MCLQFSPRASPYTAASYQPAERLLHHGIEPPQNDCERLNRVPYRNVSPDVRALVHPLWGRQLQTGLSWVINLFPESDVKHFHSWSLCNVHKWIQKNSFCLSRILGWFTLHLSKYSFFCRPKPSTNADLSHITVFDIKIGWFTLNNHNRTERL